MADFDVNISDGTSVEVVITPAGGAGAGVSDHGELTGLADDDHTQYHTDARGDARYKPLAYVPAWTDVTGKPSVFPPDTHNHDERYFTETEADARYLQSVPGSYATDAEVATAISDHEAASDPHTGYQKESEKGQASGYASLDGSGLVPDAQIPPGVARDSELTSAISTHEAASDPHTGYQKESEKDQNDGYAGLNSSGRVPIARLASGTPDGTKFLRDDGTLAVPAGASLEAWHTVGGGGEPAFQNSWTGTMKFRKDSNGLVTIQAAIASGTTTATTVIVTMPSGYRIAAAFDGLVFACASRSGSGVAFSHAPIQAMSSGDIRIPNNGGVSNNSLQISISYYTD